jgi:cell division protein FtsB
VTARRKRRPARSTLALRWLAVGAIALVAFLYYRPVRTYLDTRGRLEERRAEVRNLQAQKRALERRLAASTSSAALVREARRLGYVRPGEHLYIVKGIPQWRRVLRTSMGGDG